MKWFREEIEYFIVAFLFIGVFFLIRGTLKSVGVQPPADTYANHLFVQTSVHRVDIFLQNEDYEHLLDSPEQKTKFHANVSIDGDYLSNVAFSTRGNASLGELATRGEDFNRFSYKIDFNKFENSQSYYGLDELVLNNLYADPSGMRDFLAFEIMCAAGVETPLTSYTMVYLNGRKIGLYLAVEEIEQSFLRRNNASPDASLFKPEPLVENRYKVLKLAEALPGGEEDLHLKYDSSKPDFDFEGADLIYVSDDLADYAAIFDNEVTKVSPADRTRIIEAIKSLSTGENVEEYWDVDALVKYFAAHNFVVNSDSYTGYTAHNYLLRMSHGKMTMLPWDYNLAFQNLWLTEDLMTPEKQRSWDINNPLLGPDLDSRPLWRIIAENEEYMEKYHAALQNLLDTFLISGDCSEKLDDTYMMIRPYLEADWRKFYPIEEMDEDVEYLEEFIYYRSDWVQKQLWGIEVL